MKIDFAAGEAGFREAHSLYRILRHVRDLRIADSDLLAIIDTLCDRCEAHLAEAEFAALMATLETIVPAELSSGGPSGIWRNLFGPSRREMKLSAQRIAALERAERAERSSFESLGETARVARERDDTMARIHELEAELGKYKGA
jgi:hypothetical protein